ncbi:MAG TPA: GNAT family N-acetyltransferase [Anaerolineales bacterium]|jgi:mycothiol synthase
MNDTGLPAGYNLRPTTWSDLEGVTQLILAACTADGDATMAVSAEELAQEWKIPGFNLETDCWVVTNPDGMVVGTEEFYNSSSHADLRGDGYVHPDHTGLGIGTSLLSRLDARARLEVPLAPPDLRVSLRNGMGINEKNAVAIHEAAGFKAIRYSWRMEINLKTETETPVWPEGVALRPFDLESQNYLVYQAHHDAFRDHWGHVTRPYEFWQTVISGNPEFDPALWFVAWDADQIAGYALCRTKQGMGWVGTLGVRRAWRKRGLGEALLKHSFRELKRRGHDTVGLTVDASNPTGATRLYERVGMQVASQFVIYEKEYRPGRVLEE